MCRAIAFIDGDLEAVIGRPEERVSYMVGHAPRGGVDIVVRDDDCKVVCIGTMEVCSVGLSETKKLKRQREMTEP